MGSSSGCFSCLFYNFQAFIRSIICEIRLILLFIPSIMKKPIHGWLSCIGRQWNKYQ